MDREANHTPETPSPLTLVEEVLREVDIEPADVDDRIKARLVLLAGKTETVRDELSAIHKADDVFGVAEKRGHGYSEEEQRIVKIGTLFTDIGKTGPPEASLEQSQIFVDIYALENLPTDVLRGTVHAFFMQYLPDRVEAVEAVFQTLGIDVNISLRQFYDLHTEWTLKILDGAAGIPKEPIAGAASHHRLRDDDPDHIYLQDSDVYNQKYDFGTNQAYDRAEKLINILDIYDALCRRSGLTHMVAMEALREMVKTTSGGRYANDPEILEILDDLDATAPLSELLVAS